MDLARVSMIQACVIKILLFLKTEYVLLKMFSSFTCAKQKHHGQDVKNQKTIFEHQTY
jgi:hypothetical protein